MIKILLTLILLLLPKILFAQYNNYPLELIRPLPVGTFGVGWDSDNIMYRAYTGMTWSHPVQARGGHWPYTCNLTNAPIGMIVKSGPATDIAQYDTACVITWINPSGSATPTITVTDVDNAQVSATWTINSNTNACNSADGWCFIDAVNGNDTTGNGSLSNPWQTIAKVWNTVTTDSNILVFKTSGNYPVTGMTQTQPGDCVQQVAWNENNRPTTWIAYDDNVIATIDFQYDIGVPTSGPCMELTGQNIAIIGLRLFDVRSMGFQLIRLNRFGALIWKVIGEELSGGFDGANSAFFMWVQNTNSPSWGDYVGHSSFNNITSDACAIKLYSIEDGVIEHNYFRFSSGNEAIIAIKMEVPTYTIRANRCKGNLTCIGGNMNGAPSSGSTFTTSGEIYHNSILDSGTGFSNGGITIGVSKVNTIGATHVYKNMINSKINIQNLVTADGPYNFTSNVHINDTIAVGSCPIKFTCTSITDFSRLVLTTNLDALFSDGAIDPDGNLVGNFAVTDGIGTGSPKGFTLPIGKGYPLPGERFVSNWSNVGVTLNGGIPNRTNQCGATLQASDFGHGITITNSDSNNDTFNTVVPHPFIIGDNINLVGHNAVVSPSNIKNNYIISDVPTSTSFKLRALQTSPVIPIDVVTGGNGGNAYKDSTSAINAAITACGDNQVVLLSPGIFRVDSIATINKNNITVRGAGMGQTIIDKSVNGANRDFATGYLADDFSPAFRIGTSSFPHFQNSSVINLVTDAVQGRTSVLLNNTTGLSVGQYVELAEDQFSTAVWANKVTNNGQPHEYKVWTGTKTVWARHQKNPGVITITSSDSSTELFNSAAHNFAPDDYVYLTGHTGTLNPAAATGIYQINTVPNNTSFTLKEFGTVNPIDVTSSGTGGTIYASKRNQDDFLPGPPDPIGAPLAYYVRGHGYVYGEIKEIASISGNIVTFTSPFISTYRTDHIAQIAISDNPFVVNSGIENISIYRGANSGLMFNNAAKSWAKDVEIKEWLGQGIHLGACFRCEVVNSLIHFAAWPKPGGGGYAMGFGNHSSEALIWNNIHRDANKVIVAQTSGAGSVVAYNYMDDSYIWDIPQSNTPWVEVGLNASHFSGANKVLFEGNYSHNFDSDYTHGSADSHTVFRNHLSGYRANFPGMGNARTIGLGYGSRNMSFIGNILGLSGQMTGWTYDAGIGNNWLTSNFVWKLGYDPVEWFQVADPQVLNTSIREGNYDYLNLTTQWSGAPLSLPNSLFLTTKPFFFQTCTWPWVDSIGSTKIYTLPAKARYDTNQAMNTSIDVCSSEGGGGIVGANSFGGLTRVKIR